MKLGKARMLGVVLVGMILSFSSAAADEYPSRPITLIVQFSAGTTTDIIARRIGEEVGKNLGQPIVCVNKAGGRGNGRRGRDDPVEAGWIYDRVCQYAGSGHHSPYAADPLRPLKGCGPYLRRPAL